MPAAGTPTIASPGSIEAPVTIESSATSAEAGADEVEAVGGGVAADQLGQHRELAARDLHLGLLGAFLEADGDRAQHGRVGLLDRDVVDEGDRIGADADQVVDVHRDAVDPDGVVSP